MPTAQLLGYAAGALTTVAFIPQVVRLYRHKSARDISLPTFTIFSLGVACWLAYGLLIRDVPIILWNCVTLALAIIVVVLTVRYRRENQPATPSE